MADFKLPSGKVVEIVGMKGRDERNLLKDVQANKTGAYDDLMRTCTKSIDGEPVQTVNDILDLHSGDRRSLLLYIRQETHGSEVKFQFDCPQCRQKNHQSFSLDDIDHSAIPLNLSTGPVPLPRSKAEATWALPTGHAERKLAQKKRGAASIDLAHLLLSRDVALNGKVAKEADIEDMPAGDLQFIIGELKQIGGPDTALDASCTNCNSPYTGRVEGLPDFFFPGVMRE